MNAVARGRRGRRRQRRRSRTHAGTAGARVSLAATGGGVSYILHRNPRKLTPSGDFGASCETAPRHTEVA